MTNEHEHNAGAEHHATAAHSDKNVMAILAYLWVLILIPFLTDSKNDPFVKYHLKQGLVLVIFEVIGWFLNAILIWIPIIGWLLMLAWWLVSLAFVIIGIMHVLNGQEKELPYIGQFAKRFTF